MNVILRHPRREVAVDAPISVDRMLKALEIVPETVLVIRGADLLTRDAMLEPDDTVEVRPVISGG
jgi:sulfur carrier protein